MTKYLANIGGRLVLHYLPDNAVEINDDQEQFFLQNQDAKLNEVIAMQLDDPPGPTLEELRQAKLSALNAWNAGRIAAGYTDPEGRIWGITDADTSTWDKLLSMANLLQLADAAPMPQQIRERDGVTMHSVTFGEYKNIILGVGQAYMLIDATYASARAQILSAATAEELNSIQFS